MQEDEEKECVRNALPHCTNGTITISGCGEDNSVPKAGKVSEEWDKYIQRQIYYVQITYVKSKEMGEVVVSGLRHRRAPTGSRVVHDLRATHFVSRMCSKLLCRSTNLRTKVQIGLKTHGVA